MSVFKFSLQFQLGNFLLLLLTNRLEKGVAMSAEELMNDLQICEYIPCLLP
jgi:hypothetical protein